MSKGIERRSEINSPEEYATVVIRQANLHDSEICGRICYDAFRDINEQHGFPPELPAPEAGRDILASMIAHPEFYCVVAELAGRIVGSNCMDERSVIGGIGPITIDPEAQNRGVGRMLMRAILNRAQERKLAGVRLVQAAFHNRSLSLYASLGFCIREPLAVFQGTARQREIGGHTVRPAQLADIPSCNEVCARVHGHNRGREFSDATSRGSARVVERGGNIVGYSTGLGYMGHSVAENNLALQALIGSSDKFSGPGILVPVRNNELFRWCLANGLRVVQPMTLMTVGLYNEPDGAWLPSILF